MMPRTQRIAARCIVWRTICPRVAPRASLLSIANTADTPIAKTKVGKTRSVAVRPFQAACFMKPHDPPPPLLLTMIMKAIVIPRATSRLRSLGASPGRGAVLADGVCVTAALAAYGMADWRHSPSRCPSQAAARTALTARSHAAIWFQLAKFWLTTINA